MRIVCLHGKAEIERHLRHDIYLNLYAVGDLDDFFWRHTTWYALEDDDEVKEIALVYSGSIVPTLLALSQDAEMLRELLGRLTPLLPRRMYAHLSLGAAEVFGETYGVRSNGVHYKMALMSDTSLDVFDTSEVVSLGASDLPELKALYRESYPGNWFDPRMLETDHYYGIRRDGALVSAAGVHVYSPTYKVAALGNITTHPGWRGKGLGGAVTARLCQELRSTVEHIGLNVKASNTSAIKCYERLGFEIVASYEECALDPK